MTGIATWLATSGLRSLGSVQLLSSSSYPYRPGKTFQRSAILPSLTCMTSTSFPDQVRPFRVTESVFRTTAWSSLASTSCISRLHAADELGFGREHGEDLILAVVGAGQRVAAPDVDDDVAGEAVAD